MWVPVLELLKCRITICSVTVEDFNACLLLLLAASRNQETRSNKCVKTQTDNFTSNSLFFPKSYRSEALWVARQEEYVSASALTWHFSGICIISTLEKSQAWTIRKKCKSLEQLGYHFAFWIQYKANPFFNIRFLIVAEWTYSSWQQHCL